MTATDSQFKVVSQTHAILLEHEINQILKEGGWRLIAVDVKASENHFYAFLAKRDTPPNSGIWDFDL